MRLPLLSTIAMAMTLSLYGQQIESNNYGRAIWLYSAENYASAIEAIDRAYRELPTEDMASRARLAFYKAVSLSKSSEDGQGEYLESFISSNPSSPYLGEANFILADIYIQQQRYEDAATIYQDMDIAKIESDQLNRFYFNYGYSLLLSSEMDQSYEQFLRAEATSGEYSREATYYIAYIDYTREEYAKAKQRFLKIADMDKFSGSVPYFILQIEFAEGNYSYVTEHDTSLIDSASDQYLTEVYRIVGESFFHQQRYDMAERYLTMLSQNSGEMGRNENYLLGYSLYMLKMYDQAASYFSKIVEGEDSLSQNAYYHLGDCYLRCGDKSGALSAFSMASSFDHNDIITEDALYNFIKLQHELSGSGLVYDRSISSVNSFLERYPNNQHITELESILIDAYINSNDYKQAYDVISKMGNRDNRTREALQKVAYMRGVELISEGDYKGAELMFDEAIANPMSAKFDALSKFWKAEAKYMEGDYSSATTLYRQYINVAPKSGYEYKLALYNLGYSYFNRKIYQDALSWFTRFVETDFTDRLVLSDAYNRIADIEFSSREYNTAIDQYNKALEYNPSSSYAKYQQALAYGLKGDTDKKISLLTALASSDEQEGRDMAMLELGRTYIRKGSYEQGAKMLQQLYKEMPSSPLIVDALSELGLAYQNMGDSKMATQYYKSVVENYPQSPEAKNALLGLKSIYTQSGNVDEYIEFAEQQGIDTNASGERESLIYSSAERAYASGSYSESVKLFGQYLDQFKSGSKVATATFCLADSYNRLGDRDNALDNYILITNMSVNEHTANSIISAATILMDKSLHEEAYNLLLGIDAATTDKEMIKKALEMSLNSAIALDDRAKSLEIADKIISNKSLAAKDKQLAYTVAGRYNIADREYEDAIKNLKAASYELKSRSGAEAKYLLAKALFMDTNTSDAESEILDFAKRGTPQRDILARAFILLGDIYLYKGDSFQAKATYQSVIDGYESDGEDDGIKKEAEEKRNQIKEG